MTIAVTMDDAPPGSDLPWATRLLPGLVSAFAAVLALLLLGQLREEPGLLLPLLQVQASLLALGGAALAAGVHGRLCCWEARGAPQSARDRVRAGLLRDLWRMAALGMAGPLALAAVVGWPAGDARPLLGAFAVLGACLCAGLCVVQGWQGRAPRGLLLLALLSLPGLLAVPGVVAAVCSDVWLALLTSMLSAAVLWRGVLAPRALAVRAPALPSPSVGAWRRRWASGGSRGWELVQFQRPYRTLSGTARRPAKVTALMMVFAWLPQFLAQAPQLRWLAWGQAYDHPYAAACYGLWLLLLAAFCGAWLIAPPLHWRRRLAPRGQTPQRWARRLVLGSMLVHAGWFSVGIALSVLANRLASRALHADAWLPAMGDVLLVIAFAAWQRGRFEDGARSFACLLGFGLAAIAVLAVLPPLGLTPARGGLWLLIELALTGVLARAAIRAWSERDPNAMA